MNVLHYVERWLDISAGFVAAQIDHSRHDAVVVSREPFTNLGAFPRRPRLSLTSLHAQTPGRWQRVTMRAISAARHVDLVHVHFGYAVNDAIDLATRRRIPMVLSLYGHDATALPRRLPEHYRRVVDVVDTVVVLSAHFVDVVTQLGFPADRVVIAPIGVDTTALVPTPVPLGPPVVTYVGRLVPKKGLDVLLAAWPDIVSAVPEATLRIVGDGPLADLLPVGDSAIVHERPDQRRRADQVREAIASATVVVTPSRTAEDGDAESLLLVNLEAMASGRPVVTSRHGGILDYAIGGDNCLLVSENDAAGIADAVIRVLTDADLAARLSSSGRQTAERYDVRRCTERVDEIYDGLRGAK